MKFKVEMLAFMAPGIIREVKVPQAEIDKAATKIGGDHDQKGIKSNQQSTRIMRARFKIYNRIFQI